MSTSRFIAFAMTVVFCMTAVLGYRWHQYVTNSDSPYDEVGITLNGIMPGPLNKWGCDRLHDTFGNVLPPLNCEADDGAAWR